MEEEIIEYKSYLIAKSKGFDPDFFTSGYYYNPQDDHCLIKASRVDRLDPNYKDSDAISEFKKSEKDFLEWKGSLIKAYKYSEIRKWLIDDMGIKICIDPVRFDGNKSFYIAHVKHEICKLKKETGIYREYRFTLGKALGLAFEILNELKK